MSKHFIRIEHDDHPEEVFNKFKRALVNFGIILKEEKKGEGYVDYRIDQYKYNHKEDSE